MNFGRAVGLFNRFSPKISKGIGQVANIARNVGQAVQNVRNIGSTVNDMSGGRIGSTPLGQKHGPQPARENDRERFELLGIIL